MKDFKFIIKKHKDRPSSAVTLQEIHALLGLAQLEQTVRELKAKLEDKSDITKETLLEILKEDVLLTGQSFNITNAANIEKKKTIKVGTIYYNVTKDVVRIKGKKGWTNLQ